MKTLKTTQNLILAALIACVSAAKADDASLKSAIQVLENQWEATYNANDAERLGLFYELDAVLIPPGAPPVAGRAAITQTLAGLFSVLKDLTLTVEEVRSLGDNYAVEIGNSTYQNVAEDGSLSPGSDNYQVVWHKGADGKWRYATDMFNSR
ncbi:MAG: SgcJ/EcaC family oxidoreductase [Pseudomonadales bacterium]